MRKRRSGKGLTEKMIEMSLAPGVFVSYGDCYGFADDLRAVEAKFADLISTDPERAQALYETFIAGCYEKAEEIDDSGGSFRDFVQDLFCGWIRARQATGNDPSNTACLLIAWMDDDPCGFRRDIESKLVQAFDKPGIKAFEEAVRTMFETSGGMDEMSEEEALRARGRWGGVLRSLYVSQRKVSATIALAEEMGITSKDCESIATMLASRGKPEEALKWVDRGLGLCRSRQTAVDNSFDLTRLQRGLLAKVGRRDEAVSSAWNQYTGYPCVYSYKDLMDLVPKSDRSTWHKKAMDIAKDASPDQGIELFMKTKELNLLVEFIRSKTDAELEKVSHFYSQPAAKKLERTHPEVAGRLWLAQGKRIVNAKKSKYYDAALSNFERARRCLLNAGMDAEWDEVVAEVRVQHERKRGFMSDFERIVSGSGPSQAPSFLERAKARWGGIARSTRRPSRGGK